MNARNTTSAMRIYAFAASFLSLAFMTHGASAQVNTAPGGVTWSMETNVPVYGSGINTIDLGAAPKSYNPTPIMFGVGGAAGQITFTGGATGVNYTSDLGNQIVTNGGATTITFAAKQQFFGSTWGSVDAGNQIAFYDGANLVYSLSGAQALAASNNVSGTYEAAFSFAETGFTKVVMTTINGGFEMTDITYSAEAVDVAPIPLNAASLGGLLSFLMMLGMRGKGGTQVAIRMAFASIMPRRRALA